MIEFLVMAFFIAQPPQAAGKAPADAASKPPLLDAATLRSPVEITAKRVLGDRGQATFTGDVQVRHRTLDLRCEKMIAWYNGPREVTRVECSGGVRAVDGDKTARGERAELDVPSGVLVVTGNPEARQGNTYLSGTRVRLTLGDEHLEVENARVLVETAPLKDKRRKPATKKP